MITYMWRLIHRTAGSGLACIVAGRRKSTLGMAHVGETDITVLKEIGRHGSIHGSHWRIGNYLGQRDY